MISNRRARGRSQYDQMADLQQERLRLLHERSNYQSNAEPAEIQRRQNTSNTTMPIIRQTSSHKMLRDLSPFVEQLTNQMRNPEQEARHQRRPPPNLQLDMSVINELHEVSSPHGEQRRTRPQKDKIYALKNLVDGLLEDQSEHRTLRQKKNQTVGPSQMQRYNSEATLLNHKRFNHEVRKQLEDLDRIQSKVTNEIIALRNDKIRLIKTLNEQTQQLNHAFMEMQRLERELEKAKQQQREPPEQSDPNSNNQHTRQKGMQDFDKEAIINNLRRDDDLRIGRHNVRQKIETEVTRYQQEKDIKQLQDKVLFLEEMLQKANAYIKEVDKREKAQAVAGNQQQFLQDIERLEIQLRSAQAVNEEIRASSNAAYCQLQQQLMMLKADNEQLRTQAVELLQQPERRFTYQQEILRLKAQIQKQNEAKALFAQEIGHFKRQYIELEEDNVKLRKRVIELEEAQARHK